MRRCQQTNVSLTRIWEIIYGVPLLSYVKGRVSHICFNADDKFLEDIQSLFKKVFKSYSKDVKVHRMTPTNSIMIECYVPAHLQPVIIAIIQEKEQLLKEEKVLLVKAGNITIFENKISLLS